LSAHEPTPLARVALSIASLALVVWLLVLQVDGISPGPLSIAHVQEAGLLAQGACKDCHGEGRVEMADACATCHEEVAEDVRAGTGFHGTLAGSDARDCGRCHGEHAGEEFELVSTRSFRLAGFKTREAYDHAALDFLLRGRHSELDCKDCHANADVFLLVRGARRFAGLEQACQSCHADVHRGRFARACADCHAQEHPFRLVVSFAHDDFESECAHAAVSCARCHPRGSAHDSELLAAPDPPSCARSCQDCHPSPHSEDFVAAAAVLADVPAGASCEACHSEAHGSFTGHPEAMPPGLHAASGFELEAPHERAACASCHGALAGDELAPFVVQFPARAPDQCESCHGDPHAGQFSGGPFAGAGCLACHERTAFEPATFGLEAHARAAFPLEASHQAVACTRCHAADPPGSPRAFHGTPSACAECHADAHRGAFDARLLAQGTPRDCARCHAPTRFAEYDEDGFEHGRWTGFELDGAHARAECEACHVPAERPDGNGRTFGAIAAVFGEPVERCATCHTDAHDGRFDRAGQPREVGGKTDCARCHSSESFARASQTFEHELWTGYPLADFHLGLDCTDCHVPAAGPDAAGRTFGRAPVRCADCHADPHVGQFARAGATDCARCHQDSGALAFDHQRDSRFALDEVHARLACAACHVPWPLPGGGEAVRYRPLGTECVDCHAPDFVERARRSGAQGPSAGPVPRGGRR
jgi:hypothetical protein